MNLSIWFNWDMNTNQAGAKGNSCLHNIPDSKVHGANMGPIWGRQGPGGPHVGPMNFAIWDTLPRMTYKWINILFKSTHFCVMCPLLVIKIVFMPDQNCY